MSWKMYLVLDGTAVGAARGQPTEKNETFPSIQAYHPTPFYSSTMTRYSSIIMDIILDAPKRSLVRFTAAAAANKMTANPNTLVGPLMVNRPVVKSTVVKLTDGGGPCLEVKRNGVPMKIFHTSLSTWVKTLPSGAEQNLSVQYPPKPARAHLA